MSTAEVTIPSGADAGYIESFQLSVPTEPEEWDEKLGGSPFPATRLKASKQWSGSSAGEVSVLTGGLWDKSASELLAQPLMYGKFMEYGHNGAPLNIPTCHATPDQNMYSFRGGCMHGRVQPEIHARAAHACTIRC